MNRPRLVPDDPEQRDRLVLWPIAWALVPFVVAGSYGLLGAAQVVPPGHVGAYLSRMLAHAVPAAVVGAMAGALLAVAANVRARLRARR